MNGIYVHIPFCKKACIYCDFHFSTQLKNKELFLKALAIDLALLKSEFPEKKISTIYFGGGTPSLLEERELEEVFNQIYKHYQVDKHAEITFEANPDDLDTPKLKIIQRSPINRLSIGIQSFIDRDLTWMNRSHASQQAIQCVKQAQDLGLTNISIDLIYGIPIQEPLDWFYNIQKAIDLRVSHLSAYHLTVEPNTALDHLVAKKQIQIHEGIGVTHYWTLCNTLALAGYEHYEVSNFCLPGYESKHNSSYWRGGTYLGFGPSAHSFDGQHRSHVVSNNAQYIKALTSPATQPYITREILTKEQQYNEFIITRLRAKWGLTLLQIQQTFGESFAQHFSKQVPKISKEHLQRINNIYTLTELGMLFSDTVFLTLMIEA